MTTQEAETVLLKDALRQAQHTVAFLHNCLVNPSHGELNGGYSYAYLKQTQERLEEWHELAPLGNLCYHSGFDQNCEACVLREGDAKRLAEARQTLAEARKEKTC